MCYYFIQEYSHVLELLYTSLRYLYVSENPPLKNNMFKTIRDGNGCSNSNNY